MDSKAHYLFIHWSSPIDISHLKAFKNSFESEFERKTQNNSKKYEKKSKQWQQLQEEREM